MKQRWVVVVEDSQGYGRQAYGPYTKFKTAEEDAKAISGHPKDAYVLPLHNLADEKLKEAPRV